MSYIGNPIVSTDFPVDYFSGNGSTTAFTLSIAPASVNAIDVQVSGVSQSPQTYSVSGTTLTFSAAPPSGSSNIVVRHLGIAGIPNTPSAASVSTSSIIDASVTQAKIASNVAGTGPAFSAYASANQSISSSTETKVTLDTEEFDTNSNFASSRFTPTVAGYYQINGAVRIAVNSTNSFYSILYKNGSAYKVGQLLQSSATYQPIATISSLVYLNGSTDYVELYVFQNSGSAQNTAGGATVTWFNGSMVRAA